MMTSDDLSELTPARISLWRSLLAAGRVSCTYPRFGKDDITYVPYQVAEGQSPVPIAFTEAMIVQLRKFSDGSVAMNATNSSSETQTRVYKLSELGVDGPRFVYDWFQPLQQTPAQQAVEQVTLTVPGHTNRLLYLTAGQAARIPGSLAGEP